MDKDELLSLDYEDARELGVVGPWMTATSEANAEARAKLGVRPRWHRDRRDDAPQGQPTA